MSYLPVIILGQSQTRRNSGQGFNFTFYSVLDVFQFNGGDQLIIHLVLPCRWQGHNKSNANEAALPPTQNPLKTKSAAPRKFNRNSVSFLYLQGTNEGLGSESVLSGLVLDGVLPVVGANVRVLANHNDATLAGLVNLSDLRPHLTVTVLEP